MTATIITPHKKKHSEAHASRDGGVFQTTVVKIATLYGTHRISKFSNIDLLTKSRWEQSGYHILFEGIKQHVALTPTPTQKPPTRSIIKITTSKISVGSGRAGERSPPAHKIIMPPHNVWHTAFCYSIVPSYIS